MASPSTHNAFFNESVIRDAVLSKSPDRSFEYIITMNNELQSKYAKASAELIVLGHERDDLEMEVDQLTKSRNLLTGYLKNEIEVTRNQRVVEGKLKTIAKATFWVMHGLLLLSGFMAISNVCSLLLWIFACALLTRFDYWYTGVMKEIDAINTAIDKIDTSSERIWELIDNL